MSRIGKEPVALATSVNVSIEPDNTVTVKGPKGQLAHQFPREVRFAQEDGAVVVTRVSDEGKARAMHGLSRTLLSNMVTGVSTGFTKTLEIQGVGYRAQMQGQSLQLAVGYSHPVIVAPPEGISFGVEGPRILVTGIDKQAVGQVAADIRKVRPPEPYKGKGIRYLGERVRRKAGKSGKVGR